MRSKFTRAASAAPNKRRHDLSRLYAHRLTGAYNNNSQYIYVIHTRTYILYTDTMRLLRRGANPTVLPTLPVALAERSRA